MFIVKIQKLNSTALESAYANTLAEIIQMNYNYANNKYKLAFDKNTVDGYNCIKTAKKCLCDNGWVVYIGDI